MRIIVGLGNPGRDYRDTRHNAGFMLADQLAVRWRFGWRLEAKFQGEIAEGRWGDERLILCKPATYMNTSGESAARVASFHRVDAPDVLVLVDDADLPLGSIRMRGDGSSGGHHGLESVERHLGTRNYPRLKLGIARPEKGGRDIANHVLGKFSDEERPLWEKSLQRAVDQVECWLGDGIAKAMSLYNGKVD